MSKEAQKHTRVSAAKLRRKKASTAKKRKKGRPAAPSASEAAKALFDVVTMVDVSLVDCSARLTVSPSETLRLYVRREGAGSRSADGQEVRAAVRFALQGRRKDADEEDAVLVIEATFLAVYRIPPEQETDQEALDFFAHTNGTFNLWPYWREFVQSMSVRMGLPAITAPTYRFEEAFSGPGTVDRSVRKAT